MKSNLLGLYTTIYYVDDLERAKQWYARLLGQAPYFDQPFYVGFNVAGCELGLHPVATAKRQQAGAVAYWGVKNITAACAELSDAGCELFEAVTDVGGGIKVASVLDLDGNIFGLIENPHFGTAGEPHS